MYTRALRRVTVTAGAATGKSAVACSGKVALLRTSGAGAATEPIVIGTGCPRWLSSAAAGVGRGKRVVSMEGRRHPSALLGRRSNNISPLASVRFWSSGQQGAEAGEDGKEAAEEVKEAAEEVKEATEEGKESAEGSETNQRHSEAEEAEEKTEFSEGEIEEMKKQILEGDKKQQQFREQALYLAAEMENVRSIAKKDAEGARLYAVQKFAKQLLDVADNLERAVSSAKEGGGAGASLDNLLQGVEMTSDQLQKVFKSQGLEKFGDVGDKFDPHLHDAMFEMPDADKEPGSVGQVLKCGYKLHDRVIRAAQVGTVKAA